MNGIFGDMLGLNAMNMAQTELMSNAYRQAAQNSSYGQYMNSLAGLQQYRPPQSPRAAAEAQWASLTRPAPDPSEVTRPDGVIPVGYQVLPTADAAKPKRSSGNTGIIKRLGFGGC